MSAPEIDPLYAVGQLLSSLRAGEQHTSPELRARAAERATGWMAVIRNLVSGALRVGSRQPYADTPVWATPRVVRGGFATGEPAGGGALAPHELELVSAPVSDVAKARCAANASRLTPAGLDALGAMLADRRYRIDVPEEAALLVVAWLIARGERASAAQLLEVVAPYFDRIRFHPASGPAARVPIGDLTAPVLLRTGHSVAASLRTKKPEVAVETMREAVEVWAPLTDALVALFLETVEGAPPSFVDDGGRRRVAGGAVGAVVPQSFAARRTELLARYAAARAAHTRCKRPHRPGEVLGTLHAALAASADPRALDPGTRSRVRERLAGFVSTHGVPGSDAHARLRASQAVGPSHARIGHVVARRIEAAVPEGAGIDDSESVLGALDAQEASGAHAAPGTPIPASVRERVATAREAPVATLIAQGLVGSSEVLAAILPQLSGDALALRFDRDDARVLYAASYRAFRRRRSLLLLWLQHQVRFGELPWIAAMEASAERGAEDGARACLRAFAALAIESFPATITPNKLVTELAALAAQAGLGPSAEREAELPLVEEVAADIFMGTFSTKFLRAAQLAARVLGERSLYARYYDLPCERVLAMTRTEDRWGTKVAPDFDALCVELAGPDTGRNRQARNGTIIEQASILTTHNLAALVSVLDLDPLLEWSALADRTWDTILDQLQRRVLSEKSPYPTRLRAHKTMAFAWRQLVFFLSRLPDDGARAFLVGARTRLDSRSPLARERLAPFADGLAIAIEGGHTPREQRLLGWVTGRPALFGPR